MDMAIELLGTFGKRLRVLREEHGMDQTEFAAAVSRRLDRQTLSNSSVSSMESGRSRPSLDVLLAILRELDVSADYLQSPR
jgi:transcriptional regulator with XRE-family HTH domain